MKVTCSLLVVALFLSGCATLSLSQEGMNYQNVGNYSAALAVYRQGASQGDPYCINNIGVMYENGQIDDLPQVEMAVRQYQLAARYGLPNAQQNLVRLGREVPPADLQSVYETEQAKQQQIAAQNAQLAGQLGTVLGCALGGGCAGQPALQPQTNHTYQTPAIQTAGSTLLSVPTHNNAAIALWTGKGTRIMTVTNKVGWECEYQYAGNLFTQVFLTACPSKIPIQ